MFTFANAMTSMHWCSMNEVYNESSFSSIVHMINMGFCDWYVAGWSSIYIKIDEINN